ncbi:MAG: ABC transporter ATP-binding protein [Alphaproteobacteria bacterium]|nr:ABC transporter ATP-binding protein [Alphaproteobacteria bacterium]
MVLSLRAEGLTFAYPGGPLLLCDVGLMLEPGQTLCLLGPNGTGKTTLLRCLLGLERIARGTIEVCGHDLAGLSTAEKAHFMAYVPQDTAAVFPFLVFDVVMMGRTPHLRFMTAPTAGDRHIARQAMARTGIAHLAERRFHELSGGERQLVLIARALAQGSTFLVMDEPLCGLDLGNQVRVIALVRALARAGYSILLTTHLPDHAFAVGGMAALLKDGRLRGPGQPKELLSAAELGALYGTEVDVMQVGSGRATGRFICVPIMRDVD